MVVFFQLQKPIFLNQAEALLLVFINTYKIIRVYKCISFLDRVKAKLMGITRLVYITFCFKKTPFMIKQICLCIYIYIYIKSLK